jgi:hypothetical protein
MRFPKAYCQSQHQLFFIAEMCAVLKSRQVTQLFFPDSHFSAHGRMNVDSKRTAYHRRDFELDQLFELWRDSSPGRCISAQLPRLTQAASNH